MIFGPKSSGGGGGGNTLKWEEVAEAPTRDTENGVGVYLFPDGIDQYLYTAIRVPNSYASGQQINLPFCIYEITSSGSGLLQTLTTLIRPDTDLIGNTANQRTSTNVAINVSGVAKKVTCDLTDTTGKINSVAVSPGDLLLVRLTRAYASDTATESVRFIEQSTGDPFS